MSERKKVPIGADPRIYGLWHSMKSRCAPGAAKSDPTYVGCSVHPDFLEFKSFSAWVVMQYGHDLSGWEIDKDILVPGNKVYGPNTCVFVPKRVNGLFSKTKSRRGKYPLGVRYNNSKNKPFVARLEHYGKTLWLGAAATMEGAFAIYKAAKEAVVREEAEKLKPVIREDLYRALLRYEVHITD